MDTRRVNRRLAAILIADVVGYTRLMERDEVTTHARLHELRENLLDPRIADYGGRIVKTAGDGMLVEFSSATAALRCAVEVQREIGHRNLYAAPDTKIQFRIGINLGDILVDGNDIAGDGVNVASRLETLAEPGGICIASTVYEQVHEDLGFGFIDIGEQHVKNIARPIRAYRVALGAPATALPRPTNAFRRLRTAWAAAAMGLVIIAIGVMLFVRGSPNPSTTAFSTSNAAAQLPPALSVAILPFTAPGGTAADERITEALTHDVTTRLASSARYAWVVSPGVASRYSGRPGDARTIGGELRVRYLVEGELRAGADKHVIAAEMVDTATGTQVWNSRFDLSMEQSSTSHDIVVTQLAKAIRTALFDAESRRATRARANGQRHGRLAAGHAYQRWHVERGQRGDKAFPRSAADRSPSRRCIAGHGFRKPNGDAAGPAGQP